MQYLFKTVKIAMIFFKEIRIGNWKATFLKDMATKLTNAMSVRKR